MRLEDSSYKSEYIWGDGGGGEKQTSRVMLGRVGNAQWRGHKCKGVKYLPQWRKYKCKGVQHLP